MPYIDCLVQCSEQHSQMPLGFLFTDEHENLNSLTIFSAYTHTSTRNTEMIIICDTLYIRFLLLL